MIILNHGKVTIKVVTKVFQALNLRIYLIQIIMSFSQQLDHQVDVLKQELRKKI
jgi:hypothetical protein